MKGMEVTVDIKITHIEPTYSYLKEMDTLVGYLRSKPVLSELDKRMIETYDKWMDDLEKEESVPHLKLLKE